MKHNSQWLSVMVLLAFAHVGSANGAVMNFETAVVGNLRNEAYEQNGIRMAVLAGHYDVFNCATFGCQPSNGIVIGLDGEQTGPATVRISLVDGSLFNLRSIAILNFDPSSSLLGANGFAYSFAGQPINAIPYGQFQGIAYLDVRSNANIAGGFLFDNVEVTAIPEPATGTMLAAAFAGALLARKRIGRKRAASR